MVKEFSITQVVTGMKASGKMAKKMVKEFTIMLMIHGKVTNILANLKKTKEMVKEFTITQTAE